jgi:hypothetical protein
MDGGSRSRRGRPSSLPACGAALRAATIPLLIIIIAIVAPHLMASPATTIAEVDREQSSPQEEGPRMLKGGTASMAAVSRDGRVAAPKLAWRHVHRSGGQWEALPSRRQD